MQLPILNLKKRRTLKERGRRLRRLSLKAHRHGGQPLGGG